MNSKVLYFGLLFVMSFGIKIYAQQKNEIETQEVLVQKSYTPILLEAFMINPTLKVPDSLVSNKKILDFFIKSIPVISTFVPNKATPLKLQRRSSSTPYNTFFSGGIGLKSQLYFDVSSVIAIDRKQSFGLKLYRDGFDSDINNTLLKSNQNYSRFGLHHNLRSNNYSADSSMQLIGAKNNYYGLYDKEWDSQIINFLDPSVKRNFFKLRTHWNWYEFVVKDIEFQVNITTDNFSSSEQQVVLNTDFEIPLGEGEITAKTSFIGINTIFNKSYYDGIVQEKTTGLGSFRLFWQNRSSDLKLKIGGGISSVQGTTGLSSSLLYYPEVEIFFHKNAAVIIPYFTANGGITINSYQSLSQINPYLAPSTTLKPTFNKYNSELGVRSSLASVLNFDFGLIYDQIENFMLFERLPFNFDNSKNSFSLSNAFENKYSNLDMYGFKASLRVDLAKNNFIRFETLYRHFESND
ncbi:hypothetical protein N9392_00615, partial [Flavobacteriaceae bacterium]|nr:hypothetical protein [Flavobacteriaceae bacterium]